MTTLQAVKLPDYAAVLEFTGQAFKASFSLVLLYGLRQNCFSLCLSLLSLCIPEGTGQDFWLVRHWFSTDPPPSIQVVLWSTVSSVKTWKLRHWIRVSIRQWDSFIQSFSKIGRKYLWSQTELKIFCRIYRSFRNTDCSLYTHMYSMLITCQVQSAFLT